MCIIEDLSKPLPAGKYIIMGASYITAYDGDYLLMILDRAGKSVLWTRKIGFPYITKTRFFSRDGVMNSRFSKFLEALENAGLHEIELSADSTDPAQLRGIWFEYEERVLHTTMGDQKGVWLVAAGRIQP